MSIMERRRLNIAGMLFGLMLPMLFSGCITVDCKGKDGTTENCRVLTLASPQGGCNAGTHPCKQPGAPCPGGSCTTVNAPNCECQCMP